MQSSGPIPRSRPHHWVSWAVVHQDWKLMCNRDMTYAELYNITRDPLEQSNLADARPQKVGELRTQIEEWKRSLPARPMGDVFSEQRTQQTDP